MLRKILILAALFLLVLPAAAQEDRPSRPTVKSLRYYQPQGELVDGSIGKQDNWCVKIVWGLVNDADGYKIMMRKPSSHGGGKPDYKSQYTSAIGQRPAQGNWGGASTWIQADTVSESAAISGSAHWCGLAGNQKIVVRVRAYNAAGDGRVSNKMKLSLPMLGFYLCSKSWPCGD